MPMTPKEQAAYDQQRLRDAEVSRLVDQKLRGVPAPMAGSVIAKAVAEAKREVAAKAKPAAKPAAKRAKK